MDTIRNVNDALLDAFPDIESIERLVRFGLDKNLNEIASGRDLVSVVFRLTSWAESQGRLTDLVDAAKEQNSGNEKLQALEIFAKDRGARERERSEAAVTNWELIDYRLQRLSEEVKSLRTEELAALSRVVVGPDGTDGIRQIALDGQRVSQDNSKKISAIEKDIAAIREELHGIRADVSASPFGRRAQWGIVAFFAVLLTVTAATVLVGAFGSV